MIEGLSFAAFRRAATMIMAPTAASRGLAMEIISGPSSCRMRSGSTKARPMTDHPVDLDKHRGMAAGKETGLRRALVELETKAKDLRDRQAHLENKLLLVSAASWPEAAAKARYVLTLYAAGLLLEDTRHRALAAALLADFAGLTHELNECDARCAGNRKSLSLKLALEGGWRLHADDFDC